MNRITLSEIPTRELVPGFHVRFVHAQNMTFAFWEITEAAELPEHSHPHEQVAHVHAGSFELTVDGESHVLGPGSLVVIPPSAPHSGRALTDCKITDTFYPVREDYR